MRSKPERNQIITKEEKVGCGTTEFARQNFRGALHARER
jgi:hypothetical protein